MKSLKTIDYQLGIADRKIRLISRLNPTNTKKEKKKFLSAYKKGVEYNPFFCYKPIFANLNEIERKLQKISIQIPEERNERRFFARYLEGKRKRILKKIKSVEARGTPKFAKHTKKLFGEPGKLQLEYAKTRLIPDNRKVFEQACDDISSLEAIKIFQSHIEKNSLPWKVKLRSNMSSKAGLDSRSNFLLIKSEEWFSKEEIASLVVHEIETHIFRKENGLLQSFPYLFGQGFAGPPTSEEGLAFFNETQQEAFDPRRMLLVCARTIASDLAQRKPFYDVFRHLVKRGLPEAHAWSVTVRVKRGFADTSQRGSFSKDHHYLKGYLEIKKYLEDGGSIEMLYVGKINIETIKSINKLTIQVKEPKYLPSYLVQHTTHNMQQII